MAYEVELGGKIIGVMGQDGKMKYDNEVVKAKITELIAGQATTGSKSTSGLMTSVKVAYRYDRNRKTNNDAIYNMWKKNPIMQNRIRQLNSLVFGRGFSYQYDDATKKLIDRFWRFNRIKQKLNPMMTDAQLYGEVYIALLPQTTGDVLMCVYDPTSVEVDFNPQYVDMVNQYIVGYKDEEANKDMQMTYLPLYQYINDLEYDGGTMNKVVRKVKKSLGINKVNLQGHDGVMIHVKFNTSSSEAHGTSDFRQVYGVLNDYMDFISDRLAIHQNYGSPMFDICIDTDDPTTITNRIDELAGFTIGSNPVHNTKETWKPLEFSGNAADAQYDEKAMRGLICAGMQFPEHLLFNQSVGGESSDGTFALNKLAEDMQDSFGDSFVDMHKFVLSVGGGDTTKVDEGQLIFPEISTMSEKAKAETYVLKVGANICSRKTASLNTGHNWDVEEAQIQEEMTMFTPIVDTAEGGGVMGGRLSTKVNNQDPNRDTGEEDRLARSNASNISSQTFGNRKTNN
jgi:hypothetical protein